MAALETRIGLFRQSMITSLCRLFISPHQPAGEG
jgi:hypothetical protein